MNPTLPCSPQLERCAARASTAFQSRRARVALCHRCWPDAPKLRGAESTSFRQPHSIEPLIRLCSRVPAIGLLSEVPLSSLRTLMSGTHINVQCGEILADLGKRAGTIDTPPSLTPWCSLGIMRWSVIAIAVPVFILCAEISTSTRSYRVQSSRTQVPRLAEARRFLSSTRLELKHKRHIASPQPTSEVDPWSWVRDVTLHHLRVQRVARRRNGTQKWHYGSPELRLPQLPSAMMP